MKFQEIQRETYTNDELCLFLKFHLRIASSACLVLPGIQIYFTQFSDLEFHPLIYSFCALTQICLIVIGIIGLIYSFEYIKKLQSSQTTFYETQDDLISRGLFIITCFLVGLVINLGIISPIIFKIGLVSKIAQLNSASFEDVQLFQQAVQAENTLIIQILIIAAETISLVFIGYVFLLFSKNITTYNYFIYIFAIFANILALIVYQSQDNIESLTKVHFIPYLDNEFLVTFISQTSLLVCLLAMLLFLIDVSSTYYRFFRNPILKFILGNVLIGLSFAFVGSNGKLIRNLSIYQQNYQTKEDCRNYMNLIPELILENAGCKQKYFGKTKEFLTCPKDQQTWVWENEKSETACLNWNCCGLISQLLLNPYITYCFMVNLETIFFIMLAIMLYQIRIAQDNAISQTIKFIALFLSISIMIAGLFTDNSSPDIQVYRKVYVEPQNYLPINNVNTLPARTSFQTIDWLPELCSTTISSDTVNQINNSITTENEVLLSINDGAFLLNNINQKNIFTSQFLENTIDYLYIKGTKENIIQIIENNLSLCIYTTQSSINWEIMKNQRKQHFLISQQQQTLSKILNFINVNLLVNQNLKGQIFLYDSLIYNCQNQNKNSFMKITDMQTNVFHNYPKGQYGTIIFQQEYFKSCIYFQTNQNIYIQTALPLKSDLSIVLQWFGASDLDLIVENSICKVGPKNSINCGTITSVHDSLIGNQQLNQAPIGLGEQITIDYLSSFDYSIYIQITMTKDEYESSNQIGFQELLIQSNAQVQLFTSSNQLPQASISVRQIVLQETTENSFKLKWFVGCVEKGKKLKIINNIQIQTKC